MKKALIYIIVFALSPITFPVYLILSIVNKDKSYKEYLIASGLGIAFLVVGLVLPDTTTETDEVAQEEPQPVVEEPEPEPEPVEEEPEEAEPVEEEPEPEPKEEETEEPEPEEPPFEFIDDGIALVESDIQGGWSISGAPQLFSADGVQILEEHHEEFDQGVIFANHNTLTDQYGNETETYTMAVYYSPETIDKINFDNWPILDGEDLFRTADSVYIHPVIDNEDYFQFRVMSDQTPGVFYNFMGGEVPSE